MLADEVVADGLPGTGCDPQLIAPVLKRIAGAQKYVLAPQFAAVADALAEDYGSLVKAFPFCRLPYPNLWIELAAADRPNFMAAEMHAPAFQGHPRRIGFLLTATAADLSAWKAHLFWSLNNPPERIGMKCGGAGMAMDFDMANVLDPVTAEELQRGGKHPPLRSDVFTIKQFADHPGWTHAAANVKLAMIRHSKPSLADYGVPNPAILGLLNKKEVNECFDLFAQLARSDWAGECAYLLAVIGLVNARNATELVAIDQHRLNRARVKRGERPLYEHHVLKIHTRQQRRVQDDGQSRDHTPIRGHFVAGHWKVRRTGIFFWHPFRRGDFTKGKIDKTYEVS